MELHDHLYGSFTTDEPVIIDLINSAALQRLKKINQGGYSEPFLPGTRFSRYEHSIGVFLLLKKYHAPLAEQISGLLHDVSHAVFSHCIDYVFSMQKGHAQDHQDNVMNQFIKTTDVPAILQRHGFNLNFILDDRNFPLKETQLPNLCADRIDYSLREIHHYRKNPTAVATYLEALEAADNRWVFKNFSTARQFAQDFFDLNTDYWSGPRTAAMFFTVGEYLRYAMGKKYIVADDLYTTDDAVLKKVASHHHSDSELQFLFERMNNKIPWTVDKNATACVGCKSRVVNPLFRNGTEIKQVSDVDSDWSEVMKTALKPKQYCLRFAR